jgi:hypothetical protein
MVDQTLKIHQIEIAPFRRKKAKTSGLCSEMNNLLRIRTISSKNMTYFGGTQESRVFVAIHGNANPIYSSHRSRPK